MISVLIPVYNFDIRAFAGELHTQLLKTNVAFEIRCYDDFSQAGFRDVNKEVAVLDHVVYKELSHNHGRSAIRNLLARDAVYEKLLFLDCDSFPERPDFISSYLKHLDTKGLMCGGRSYDPEPPLEAKKYFRWLYGSQREVLSAEQRQGKPYQGFQTNNFIISKDIFLEIKLNEELKGYGHEDTLLGMELRQRNIPILHIDNPLRHLGLEAYDEFLEKTAEGIHNLAFLIRKGIDPHSIRLARTYKLLNRWGLCRLFQYCFLRRENAILKNLQSDRPSLRKFDLFKLHLLIREMSPHSAE